MFVQNKLVLKNSSDSHEYVCMSVENFLFCFWSCEVMFDWSKGFKLQFEGFKEPIFKTFILLA